MLYFLGNKYYDLTLKFVQIYEFLSIKVYFFYNFLAVLFYKRLPLLKTT